MPILTARHPIMQNITSLPQLQGYIATSARPAAQVILRGPEPYSDPVLAAWQFGLGRAVAFTSDATARWASSWVSWEEFATFWSQAVRWTITEGTSSNLETRIVRENEQARIIVDARDNDGKFLNGLNLQASVVYNQTQSARRVQLRQIAPGRYEATFTPENEGAYLIRVTDQTTDESGTVIAGEGLELTQTTGWVMSYSQEYDIRETDDRLLQSIALLTAGRDLSEEPGEVFNHNLTALSASVPLWPLLLLMALVLLPFDVGVRRLLVTRSDLRRLNAWFQTSVLQRHVARSEADIERMSSLREARDRARIRTTSTADSAAATRTINALRSRQAERREQQPQAQPEVAQETPDATSKPRFDRERAPAPPSAKKHQDGENIGARLLKNRRREEE